MQLIDYTGQKILTHRLHPTADFHVAAIGRASRLIPPFFVSLGHKNEGFTAFHLDWIARVMRQYKGWCVVGRIVAPPASPPLIRPRTANRSEHIAAEYEGAEPIHGGMS